jgi:hypothetical protein
MGKGCKYLSRASLPSIQDLNLGIWIETKEIIELKVLECCISLKPNGGH